MKKSKAYIIICLVLLLLAVVTAAVSFGSVSVSMTDILGIITGRITEGTSYTLITAVRIPRVLGGIFAGIGLSCAGVILQNVMNNALASPNTIGVNSGAGFAVMLCMLLIPDRIWALPVFAFAGALAASVLIFALAWFADSSRTTIILAGITVSAFLNAGIQTIRLLDTDIAVNLTSFLLQYIYG